MKPPPARHEPHLNIEAVSSWVLRFADQVATGGKVLDVACGAGRHALFFAQRGHPVDAVDRDIVLLSEVLMAQTAVEQPAALRLVQADIETGPWPFPDRLYAAVVVTNYLHRPLFPALLAAVEPGGLLVYETFALGNERYGRPSRAEFLLRPGELLEIVRGDFEVLAYESGPVAAPKPAIIQRIVAKRLDVSGNVK